MLAPLAPLGGTAVLVFPEGRARSECLEPQSTGHRLHVARTWQHPARDRAHHRNGPQDGRVLPASLGGRAGKFPRGGHRWGNLKWSSGHVAEHGCKWCGLPKPSSNTRACQVSPRCRIEAIASPWKRALVQVCSMSAAVSWTAVGQAAPDGLKNPEACKWSLLRHKAPALATVLLQ